MKLSINELIRFLAKTNKKELLLGYFQISNNDMNLIKNNQEVDYITLLKIKRKLNLQGIIDKDNRQYYLITDDVLIKDICNYISNNLESSETFNKKYQSKLKEGLLTYKTINKLCEEIGIGLSTYYRILNNPKHIITENVKRKIKAL